MPLPSPVHRLIAPPRYYLGGLWTRLNEDPVFIWAQAIAFKVLITILPLILIATGVFGLVLRQDNPFETVAGYLRTFLPPGQSQPIIDLLFRLQQTSPALTIVGVAVLVVVVITLFSVLRYVIGTSMGAGRHLYRSILHGYLFDARMALQVGLLFLISFGLTLGINVLNAAGQELLTDWGLHPDLLQAGQRLVLQVVALAVPFLFSVAMFAQLFYFIPRPRPPSSSAFFGAFFTALLFEVAKNAFTLYATYLGQFNRYGSGDEAIGGVFGLLIAFVVWVYFSGLVLIIGAMMTHLHEQRHNPERSRLRRFVRKLLFRKRRIARAEAKGIEVPSAEGPERNGAAEPGGRQPDTQAPASAAGTTGSASAVTPASPDH